MRPRRLWWTKTCGPRHHHRTQTTQTEAQSRRADLFTTAAVPAAARLWMCVWHPPMQQQLAGTLRNRALIVKSYIADIKYLIFGIRASSTARLSGQQMGDRTQQSPEPCSMQPTPRLAATDSKCRSKPSTTDGCMKSR